MKHLFFIPLAAALLLGSACSCSTSDSAAQILGSSSEAPVFLSCKAVSETEIDFQFSLPVRVVSLRFSPAVEVGSVEEGSTLRVNLAKRLGPGERLVADLLAEDAQGNTINVLIPLRARNDRIPELLITELRTEHSKPKTEFIEFKIVKAGNLAALRVFIAANKEPLVYEFPQVEVAKGEYVVLHLRTLEETCRDELGSSLDESGGTDAAAGARDLWVPGTAKLLHKTDAVYVLDQDDKVLDAVMLAEESLEWWNKESLAEAAEFLYSQGAWTTPDGGLCGPKNAVDTSAIKTALTRSVSRNEKAPDTNTAADWYITSTGGVTIGKPNK
jgi:hypothetical protein